MNDTLEYQVEKILADFDFEKVHKAMKAVDWKWTLLDGTWGGRVPTARELESQARELLFEVADSDHDTYISTGGFTVLRIGNDIQLLFIFEEHGEQLHYKGVVFPGKKAK